MTAENKAIVMEKINRTMENLRKNNMAPFYCENKEQACELVKSLINEGDVISSGGSVTLKETGILDIIKSDKYNYLDRTKPGMTREQVEEVYRQTYTADAYFASSNAITEDGLLYNVDGNSNRVSAILYGPKSVILVCGYNKIVKNLDEAVMRVKCKAAPPNTVRLELDTYCKSNGKCVSLLNGDVTASQMCDGCHSEKRICCNFVVSSQQRHKDRIKVIIIGEEYGY